MSEAVHIGVTLPNLGSNAQPATIERLACTAEERGFASVWVSDHVVMKAGPLEDYPYSEDGRPPFDPSTRYLDPLVTLGFVAASTNRVQLGTGVLVLPLRHPIAVAKQVASLDVISSGRALLGVGSGWLHDEFELLGQGWRDRGRRTDRGIDTLRGCWGEDPIVPGIGPVAIAPPPPQGRQLPVLIGGHSPAALRRAAVRGDGWYATKLTPSVFAERLARLRQLESPTAAGATVAGVRPDVVSPDDAPLVTRSLVDAGADFIVLGAPYEDLTAAEAMEWIERTADALGLDGDPGPPIASRRCWPDAARAAGG